MERLQSWKLLSKKFLPYGNVSELGIKESSIKQWVDPSKKYGNRFGNLKFNL